MAVMPMTAQGKFDAGGRMTVNEYRAFQADPSQVLVNAEYLPVEFSKISRGDNRVAVFVTLAEGVNADFLQARGLDVTVDCGDMVLAVGNIEDIIALDRCPEVKALSFGERRSAKLNIARKETGAEVVHEGTEFEFPYKGKGVITGIYDTGLDPNHANFCDANGNTRVARVFSYSGSSGQVNIYTTPERISRFTTDNSQETHGTHTAGCMAGGFNRRGGGTVAITSDDGGVSCSARNYNPYYGMAPEATLAIGCGSLYDANITAGVNEIVSYAESESLPCVINLSIGSSIGPHDGSDATSQLLDRLGEKAIICVAAGNEGDVPMSVSKTFTATDNSVSTVFSSGNGASGYVDIWSSNGEPMMLTVMVVERGTGKISFSREIKVIGDKDLLISTSNKNDGTAYTGEGFDKAFQSSVIKVFTSDNKATNNRTQARLSISCVNNMISNSDGNLLLALKVSGSPGQRVDITTNSANSSFTDAGLAGYSDGSGIFSISSMACGKNVLVVGAWNTRKSVPCLGHGTGAFYDYEGWGREVDSIAGYSSWGVLADGRELPHVCAPGTGIISSISSYYYDYKLSRNPDFNYGISASQSYNDRMNYWQVMQGTSMSAPVVAGGIALWLEADPTLDIDRVKDIVVRTARKDEFVTGSPLPVQWGAGKFDALAGLKDILKGDVSDITAGDDNRLFVTPSGTSEWDIFLPGAANLDIKIFNPAGILQDRASAIGSNTKIFCGRLPAGLYILNVNGSHSARITVR